MSLDERIRAGLQEMLGTGHVPGDESRLNAIVSTGKRHRAAIVASSVIATLVLVSAGGLIFNKIGRVRQENVSHPITPSPVLSASAVNVKGTAQVSSTTVRVNEIFTITTTITKFNGLSGYADINTADGHPHGGKSSPSCLGGVNNKPLPKKRSSALGGGGGGELPYAYREPGTYHLTITFRVYRPCSTIEETAGPAAFDIVVSDGPRRSAGPFPAKLIGGGINDEQGVVHLDATLFDYGGWVSRVTLSWGDGTTRVYNFPLSSCRDPGTYWASSSASITGKHAYTKPGKHTLSFKVTTSGCDGRSLQEATIRHDFCTPLHEREDFFPRGFHRGPYRPQPPCGS